NLNAKKLERKLRNNSWPRRPRRVVHLQPRPLLKRFLKQLPRRPPNHPPLLSPK
ncbi:hypothetical protein H0H93_004871, partial [Arthromyces matolae]